MMNRVEMIGRITKDIEVRKTQTGLSVARFTVACNRPVQKGKNQEAAEKILEQAKQLEKAGVFAIVLEMIPQECGKFITENISVPTISCGAGKYCDAQVLVCDDVFGKFSEFKPKFARKYGDMKSLILNCAKQFDEDVKSGKFPNEEEIF